MFPLNMEVKTSITFKFLTARGRTYMTGQQINILGKFCKLVDDRDELRMCWGVSLFTETLRIDVISRSATAVVVLKAFDC